MVVIASALVGAIAYPLGAFVTQLVGVRVPLYPWLSLGALVAAHAFAVAQFDATPTELGLDRAAWRPLVALRWTLLGAAVVLVPAALLFVVGAMRFEDAPAGPWLAAWGIALWTLVPAALTEELLARGYLFALVRSGFGLAPAVVLTSVAFGALHLLNPGASFWSMSAVAVAGAFLAIVRVRSGSLIAAWGAHLAVNVAQGPLLHAPISGLALPTPGYRAVMAGPSWLTGGAWGIEAAVPTVALLAAVTFLGWPREASGAASTDRASTDGSAV